MAKKTVKLSEEQEKALLILKATYEMHLKTKEEALLLGKTKNIPKIDKILNETLMQMGQIDKNFADKCAKEFQSRQQKKDIMDVINESDDSRSLFDAIKEDGNTEDLSEDEEIKAQTQAFYDQFTDDDPDLYEMADNITEEDVEVQPQTSIFEEVNPTPSTGTSTEEVKSAEEMTYNNTDPNAQYDIIPLPSKGECYRVKVDRIPVAYLTAADENLITSPNLYESGNISSILLKKKILNKDIDVDNLVSGDVDAIMVFLRGTSYGNDFPIIASDPQSGKKIETTVDLSKLKYKPFNLKGDENGYFDFTLPKTKAVLKFKFLTKKEEKMLQRINKKEAQGVSVYDLNDAIDKIKTVLKNDDKLNEGDRTQIIDANNKLQKWCDNLGKAQKGVPYTKTVTNTMEMEIVSVNGNQDKDFIHQFVMNMPASDSLAFRRYVYDNQPGVDFEVEVERPVSQGGGTFKCFLEWDDYVFWHIA